MMRSLRSVRTLASLAIMAVCAIAHPLAAQNSSSLTVTFSGFSTPTGADFVAGEIRGTVTYTIACGSNRAKCTLKMTPANASVTEPANTTATTTLQYSLDNGTSWTSFTTATVTLNGGATGTTNGSFLVRYRLGWQSGGNPYTPPGSYSLPVNFTIQQGQP